MWQNTALLNVTEYCTVMVNALCIEMLSFCLTCLHFFTAGVVRREIHLQDRSPQWGEAEARCGIAGDEIEKVISLLVWVQLWEELLETRLRASLSSVMGGIAGDEIEKVISRLVWVPLWVELLETRLRASWSSVMGGIAGDEIEKVISQLVWVQLWVELLETRLRASLSSVMGGIDRPIPLTRSV